MSAAMNVSEVIQAFGGYQQAGMVLGVSRTQFFDWEQKGIPPKRWKQIALLSQHHATKPLTIEELAQVTPTKQQTSEAA
jgi:hypothetical protein